ncbi:MAG TPA: FeoA family protein, partial [candidate division Zixibacteria bacterium]|nr:FeoA family protein [candidate division Zixibacteria bacterium]
PQGLPIPEVNGDIDAQMIQTLSELLVGEMGEVIRIDSDPATRAFLEAEGFRPGIEVTPLAIGKDGATLLQVGRDRLHLSQTIADSILIAVAANKSEH